MYIHVPIYIYSAYMQKLVSLDRYQIQIVPGQTVSCPLHFKTSQRLALLRAA